MHSYATASIISIINLFNQRSIVSLKLKLYHPAAADFHTPFAHVQRYRARQLYKNISMLFLFPVKDGKLSTGANATFDASCYG